MGILGAVLALGAAALAQAPAAPTFSKDVAPILYKNCMNCHQPGDIAPMQLVSFSSAPIRAGDQGQSHRRHDAAVACGSARRQFSNDRRLTDAEKDTIARWADGGGPQGEAKDMPPAPKVVDGWEIGKPDAVFTMTKPFAVPASGEIDYQYLEIPTNFTEDKWVSAIELKPGALSVVHHILAYARIQTPARRRRRYSNRSVRRPHRARPRPAPTRRRPLSSGRAARRRATSAC